MTNTKKTSRGLVPAGTLEKLKVAVNYGAEQCSSVDKPMVCVAVLETLPWMSFVKVSNMLMHVA